jgi:hypothetical protein
VGDSATCGAQEPKRMVISSKKGNIFLVCFIFTSI